MKKEEVKVLRVVVKNAGEDAKVCDMLDKLEVLQEAVDGYIEIVHMPNELSDICCILNKDGKNKGLRENIKVPEYNDIFVGNLIFVGDNGDEFRSLTIEEIDNVLKYISNHLIDPVVDFGMKVLTLLEMTTKELKEEKCETIRHAVADTVFNMLKMMDGDCGFCGYTLVDEYGNEINKNKKLVDIFVKFLWKND